MKCMKTWNGDASREDDDATYYDLMLICVSWLVREIKGFQIWTRGWEKKTKKECTWEFTKANEGGWRNFFHHTMKNK